jgi:imidazolonepropionase-like amidohydrolase
MDDKTGSLAPGKAADLCIWDVPSYLHLFYPFAENPLIAAVINGKVAYEPR